VSAGDRQTPGVEGRVAGVLQVVGVEMLHVRGVDVTGRNVQAHAVTQQGVPVCALVREVVPPPPL
jgi:hypothetical protein